jgi:putative heme iron utilization protein
MSELITPAISDRICQHMNEDHGEAVALYAKVFGNTPQAESATMVSIDPQGMNLDVRVASETVPVRVQFDRPLKDAEDAHHTLIDMVKQARSNNK